MKKLTHAKQLIKECLDEQTTYLDLGNCGITNLGDLPELFECTHLTTLILSNKWYDKTRKKEIYSKNTGRLNNIEYVTQDIVQLEYLQNLKIGGAFHSSGFNLFHNRWQTKDISFLKDLTGLTTLDLSSNQISDYSFLKDLTGLTTLDLRYNKIISDISFLKDLTGLTTLDLSDNQISDISFLKDLTGLTTLYLSDNQISDISFLKDLTGLTTLDLRDNKISDISFLKDLTGLTTLDLRDNQISDISFLKDLTGLTTLDLSDNQISDISFLKDLTGLTTLYLRYNKIISDISFLKDLTGLTTLDLRDNKISDYSFLKDLTGLTTLDLSDNQISDISFLKDLTGLTTLDLSDNQISDISFLKDLTGLTTLDLSSNQISDISFLKDLTGLTTLDLSYNQISDISFLKDLTGLTTLYLSYNQISDISFLKDLTGLTTLDLRDNKISDISFLKDLTGLTTLDLRDNKISDISFLKDLTGLTTLDLSDNQISDISFLKDLTGLTTLYLRDNKISELPFWITDLKMDISLSEYNYGGIQLFNNPLQKPPTEIIEQGKEAVARYFEEVSREDVKEVQLLEAKVLLLGEGKTGKTSLRFKMESEENPLPKDEDRTRGVDIYHHDFHVNNDTFIGHIWDFGGQDVLYQVHRFFLSDDALYILVTDSRADQGNKFEEWLQTIEIFTSKKDNQIILLQNLKYGDTPASIDIAEYKKYYAIVCGKVFEVDLSFSEKKHIDEFRKFRDVIKHRLLELPHVKKPILSHWLAVRKELEEKLKSKTNLIKFSEFTVICNEYKVKNKEVQKDLLRYLHCLGIVLWYEQYPAIKQKVILNPEWVTTALYRIVDSHAIRVKNGKLDQEDIENLWKEPIYEDYHNELIEILQIFRLAYKRKQEDAYIVPSLMNTKTPKNHESWNLEGTWKIRYSYPRLMPRGIVNQLAAELCKHIKSDFDDVWAFGVVFTMAKANAKVQESRNRKQIEVVAYGDDRLKLMQDIVKALDDIHETYKGLEYDIKIPCICKQCMASTEINKTYYDYFKDIMREIDDSRDDIYCRNLRQPIKIAPIMENSGFALPYKLAELLRDKDKGYQIREDEIGKKLAAIDNTTKKTLENTEEIKSKFDKHFEYLIKLDGNANLNKKEIISAVQDITNKQQEVVFKDILDALVEHHLKMDDRFSEICNSLQKPGGNLEMKIKASIPLLNLLGLDIGVEGSFDIKKWSKEMYKKHKLQLFKLFGYV